MKEIRGDGKVADVVVVSGSSMELYGATVDDRPAADAVPIGAVFCAVNTQEAWQSNGAFWVKVV